MLTTNGTTSTRILLASGSPRRRAMLHGAGIEFEAAGVDLDETPRSNEDPMLYAQRMARSKAEQGWSGSKGFDFVIGSDTVVTIDGRILGKPRDDDDAVRMLSGLAGRTHRVVSAWAIWGQDGLLREGKGISHVRFAELSDETISDYIATGEPRDKAGAYGIQGLGGRLVSSFEGTFDNVVGLPMGPLLDGLYQCGAVAVPSTALAGRVAVLRARAAAACDAAGRPLSEVTLVGASKAQPVTQINAALGAGVQDLGESYVQEWLEKEAQIGAPVRWHFIGRLQRNKVKFLAPRVHMIHGVDSPKLAEAIGRAARKVDRVIPILVQVNLAAEATKSGVSVDELEHTLDAMRGVAGVEVRGLMALPPNGGLAEARRWFGLLKELRDRNRNEPTELPELSMGMSGDFDAAIVEGATMIRLGTALFGPRITRK